MSVFNWGILPQSTYEVKLFKVATPTDIELATAPGVQVAPGETASVPVTWTPDTEGATTIYARAVSYTHLRAHETVLDLVCRLLLEKKKETKNYNT